MAAPHRERNIRVLIVSKDASIRDAFYAFPAGVEVRLAGDGRDALNAMQDWIPSVVVVDLQAGNSGGYALAKDMGDDVRLGKVPVLMLLQRPHDAWLATQSGARAYRTKPVDPVELAEDALTLSAK